MQYISREERESSKLSGRFVLT